MAKFRQLLALMCLAVFSAVGAAAQCASSAVATPTIAGTAMQAIVSSNSAASLPTVSGTISVSLVFQPFMGAKVTPTDTSLYYTVDDQPVGGLLSSFPFSSTIDTTAFSDGEHVLSVKYASQPSLSCPYARQEFPFIVANTSLNKGAQYLPVETRAVNGVLSQSNMLSPAFDQVYYPGYRPHATAHPYTYVNIPPANGVPQSAFFVEPLNQVGSDFAEGTPDFYQLPNGAPVTSSFYPEVGATVDKTYWPLEDQNNWDGPRDDNSASPYSNCVSSLDPGNPLFYCITLSGQLYEVNGDGSIQTVAGLVTKRDALPLYYPYHTWPQIPTSAQTIVGTFDHIFDGSNDMTIDPRNHKVFYVADTMQHRIAKVDTTSGAAVVTTYAGAFKTPGYVNGTCQTARFNQPYSIVMADDGTMYVADKANNVIRSISADCSTVSTVVGVGHPGSATPEPSTKVVAASIATYGGANGVAVPFSSAYINYPFAIRFDSYGNLIEVEPATMMARRIDLTAKTVTSIAQLSTRGDSALGWMWLDVDSKGTIGSIDDVVMTRSQCNGAACAFKFPETGTASIPPPLFPKGANECNNGGPSGLHFGPSACGLNLSGHYSWMVAISKNEGRAIFAGFGSNGIFSFHLMQPTDPAWAFSSTSYSNAVNIWRTGTVKNFPFGARPSFRSVHGPQGYSRLGNVLNADDMAQLPDCVGTACTVNFCTAQMPAGTLGAYLQSGADGRVARPELTGNDLRDVVYFVRRQAVGNALSQVVKPGPSCTGTLPIISNVAVTPAAGRATVTWTTQVPSLGVVQYGTNPGQYFAWSNIESGYSTSHSVSLDNLAAPGTVVYYEVQSKNIAGGQATVVTGSFTAQ